MKALLLGVSGAVVGALLRRPLVALLTRTTGTWVGTPTPVPADEP